MRQSNKWVMTIAKERPEKVANKADKIVTVIFHNETRDLNHSINSKLCCAIESTLDF